MTDSMEMYAGRTVRGNIELRMTPEMARYFVGLLIGVRPIAKGGRQLVELGASLEKLLDS